MLLSLCLHPPMPLLCTAICLLFINLSIYLVACLFVYCFGVGIKPTVLYMQGIPLALSFGFWIRVTHPISPWDLTADWLGDVIRAIYYYKMCVGVGFQ